MAFEAPLLRQSYHLHLNDDRSLGALSTPWLLQAFQPDLSALRGRVRWEDAGHYFKYAALAPGGSSLLPGREPPAGPGRRRWRRHRGALGAVALARRRQGPGLGHRGRAVLQHPAARPGLRCRGGRSLLMVELHQQGYSFQAAGSESGGPCAGDRAGERPAMSQDGTGGWPLRATLACTFAAPTGLELWRWPHQERIRAKQVAGPTDPCWCWRACTCAVLMRKGVSAGTGSGARIPGWLGGGRGALAGGRFRPTRLAALKVPGWRP